MRYTSTIEYLYGLQKYGMKFGLDNIRKLMAALDNPQHSFASIHVGGTNGKGSTSAMIESVLRTAGIKTGLFTSPHLMNFTERIRINGEEISEKEVIDLADQVRGAAAEIADFSPTFFEVVTAIALLHFRKTKTDYAVIEVGLGGRLDSTNIIVPEVSVITSIGLDHCELLGRTLKEIAGEKAGIIKDGVPIVTAEQPPEVMEVIARKTSEHESALFRYGSEFSADMISEEPMLFRYQGDRKYDGMKLPLLGEHQIINASMAIKTVEIIQGKYPWIKADIKKGIENVRWPGRIEMVRDYPPILIDGAHNPHAALALSKYLKNLLPTKYRRILLVMGIMGDKDVDGVMGPLLPLAAEIIFASPAYGRAASLSLLESHASSLGYTPRMASSVSAALKMAEDLFLPGDLIVVTGSFYTLGEAKEALGDKGVLSRLRE
jgi:dihydrofolate synthase / folylpolyglutamate synthase